jgi:small conductance mechanosensitive channel
MYEQLRAWGAGGLMAGGRILLILALAFVLARALRAVAARVADLVQGEEGPLGERARRAQTLAGFLQRAAALFIFLIAFTMILRELGVDVVPIIAGAGLAGVALGFGAQNLIKDLIAGFLVLSEDQFRVGDVIRTAGVSGQVERITLRMTQVRDVEGVLHTVPNGEIKVVSNLTKEFSRVALDVGVSYGEDLDRVIKVLEGVARDLAGDPQFAKVILEPPRVLGVEALGESQVTLRLLAKTEPLRQWDVARELRKRIKTAFDREGIHASAPDPVIGRKAEPPATPPAPAPEP